MKQCLAVAVLLFTSLASFGVHTQPSKSNQFHAGGRNAPKAAAKASEHPVFPWLRAGATTKPARPLTGQRRFLGKRAMGAANSTTVSFVTATQIPTTGIDDNYTEPVMGDFNGDGKVDVAKIVYNSVSDVQTYQISTLLGNGDGTFQTAVLTNTPGNADDPVVVGDLNGDGKDDIIQVHPAVQSACNRAFVKPRPQNVTCGASMDVLLSNGDGTFAAPVNYTISNISFLVAGVLTDVDGDGKLDVLAFDDNNPANVIALLGNGDGTFQAAQTLSQLPGAAPRSMFFADFNGDGNIDFAGIASGQIMVGLSTGQGTYAASVGLTTADGSQNACFGTAGDLNGDGKPEIVAVNCDNDSITIFVNSGTGTFTTGLYYNSSGNQYTAPFEAAIGDVNGDGNADIVVGNEYDGDISVFLGHGDGTVSVESMRYATGGDPWTTPLLADFNGDGLMDVMVADDYYSFVYLQGYGDGSFRAAPIYELPNSFDQGSYSGSVAIGDFNGDGIPDAVIGQYRDNASTGVIVYLGRGDGTFYPGVSYGPSSSMSEVVVADVNNDGKLDIAAIDDNAGVVQLFLGNGDGTFSIGLTYVTDPGVQPSPRNLVVGDFNHDGNMDIAVANSNTQSVGVLLGNGDGTFASAVSYTLTMVPENIAMADINGDGYLDLAVTAWPLEVSGSRAIGVLLANNDNSGTFQAATYTLVDGNPQGVAFGDLNGDGKADMVATTTGGTYSGDIAIALGNGDGTFGMLTDYPSSASAGGMGAAYPGEIHLVDINGDGKLDLVYLNANYGTLAVALGNGDGTIAAPIEFPTSEYPWGMALADVNNDGATDILVGQDESGGFNVLLNANGTGTSGNYTFGTQTPSATVTAGSSATYTLTMAGLNGYNGTITFSCGTLPTGASCSFNPSSVVANGNQALTTTMTISTTATTAASGSGPAKPNVNPESRVLLASFGGLGLFGLLIAGTGAAGRRRRAAIVLSMIVLLTLGMMLACDNESAKTTTTTSTGTPAGSYAVTVTSTGTGAAAPTHIVSVTLVVQ